jgi:hypothetical protein
MDKIRELIQTRLEDIQREEQVVILYACESGSRAWGFASTDSDYDVRFIYAKPIEWYLSIEEKREVMERPLTDNLDFAGWDIRKALGLFRKSNPPLLEWLQSPIVYAQKTAFVERLRDLAKDYYSPQACLRHYWHMAAGNYRKYLTGDSVLHKKYLYVLRPVLACQWIECGLGAAPMEFAKLVDELVRDESLKQEIDDLLARKMAGKESEEGKPLPSLQAFLESELIRLENVSGLSLATMTDVYPLNHLFRSTLREAW